MADASWHLCSDCQVQWEGADDECWCCGREIPGSPWGYPQFTSREIAPAMTDLQWRMIRRRIFDD